MRDWRASSPWLIRYRVSGKPATARLAAASADEAREKFNRVLGDYPGAEAVIESIERVERKQ